MAQPNAIVDAIGLLRGSADRPARWLFAAAIFLVTAGGLIAALAPLLLKDMVDAVATRREPTAALGHGALYLLALCAGRALGELRALLSDTADQRVLARLTQRLFGHLLALPMQVHLSSKAGELVHSIHMATAGSRLLTAHLVGSLLPVLVELVTVAAVLIHLGQPALLATFATTALAYLVLFGVGSMNLARRAQAVSSASVDVNATIADTLTNCEAVKCFLAEATARDRLAAATDTLQSRWSRLYQFRLRLGLAVATAFTLSVGASLLLAAQGVADGSLTIGGFVLVNAYMLQMVRPLETLGGAARDVSQAIGFIGPATSLLRQPVETEGIAPTAISSVTHSAPHVMPSITAAVWRAKSPGIRFEHIHFGYDPQRPVLTGLDLEVAPGRNLAIVGATGSGKSSLVRLLLRLCEPQSGRILLDTSDIAAMSTADVRGLVGVVPQDTILLNDTLGNNIRLGKPGANQPEVETAARRAHLHDLIASLPYGYETMVGERGLRLSGGERQRVAIARVLLKAPRIFVFDEATSMLDSATETSILHDLEEVSQGCTTITIAHRLSTVRRADSIAVIANGRISEFGPHAELLDRDGLYAALWRRQMQEAPA